MKRINVILSIAITFLLILKSNAQLSGQWPELDKPPPYAQRFDTLIDLSKIPDSRVKNSSDDCTATGDTCDWSCTGCTRDSDIVSCPTVGDWGLSFDDGPTEYTDTLLDYLASQNIRITFFVVGSRVYENPEILAKAVQAGHQIGVHTWSHTPLTTQSNEAIVAELQWTAEAIKAAAGVTPKYMRPPYGDMDDRVRGVIAQLGYKPTIWDKDTNDWVSADDPTFQLSWIEGNFTQWVKESSTTGHISLEHDLYKQTAAQAPKVVQILQTGGFNIKQIAVCRGDSQPYAENVGLNYTISTISPSAVPSATATTDTTNSDSSPSTTGDDTLSQTETNAASKDRVTSNASSTKNILPFSLIIIILINSYVISCIYTQ